MKGLIYKDYCMMKKYCKSYLLVVIVFTAISIFNSEYNEIFTFYPCLLVGMIPINLLSYDERSGWVDYCKTLPYSTSDIVSSKYLIGLISTTIVVIINSLIQFFINRGINVVSFAIHMTTISLIVSSLPLVFMFRFGVEKGRIAYYIMFGFFIASITLFSQLIGETTSIQNNEILLSSGMMIIGVIIYIIMWQLSIKLYNKNKS